MKKMIFFAAATIPLMAGIMLTGYWSSVQKQKAGYTNDGYANHEQLNKDVRTRTEAYQKSHSNWESLERDYNNDLVATGNALEDLTGDNKKQAKKPGI